MATGMKVRRNTAARRVPADRDTPTTPHSARFRTITGALVGLAIGALIVAGAIAAGGRSSHAPAAKWSPWSPGESGTLAARDIADYVAPFYRVTPADQLAVVTVVNLQSAAAAAAAQAAAANGTTTSATASSGLQVAVRPSPTSAQVSLLGGNTIAFNLCGIGGKDCSIAAGQPSTNRLLLLRREALELALYTFKYVGSTQNVVAILPPGHTTTATTGTLTAAPPTTDASPSTKPLDIAVLFQRQELAPLLSRPLADTLPEQVPPSISQMPSAPEAQLVSEVTARGLFSENLQQAQDGSNLIVLNPLPPQ